MWFRPSQLARLAAAEHGGGQPVNQQPRRQQGDPERALQLSRCRRRRRLR